MEDFLTTWGYLGIFLGIVATGLGFPMPEELPVVVGGVLVNKESVYWWAMLPVCIVAVIIGDSFLYWIGRLWGVRLVQHPWFRKHLLTPERLILIEDNFSKYGVRILLFARLTPGIRAPIFVTAGIIRLPLVKFVLADGIYAVPGVSLLFFLGYWFGDSILGLVNRAEHVKSILVLVVLGLLTAYVVYRFLRKPMVTGAPSEMPPLVRPVTEKLEQVTSKTLEQVSHKIIKQKPEAEAPCGDGTHAGPAPAPEAANPGEPREAPAPRGERIVE